MPSVSKKQHNLMAAVAKNPAFAKKVGIKQSVGKDFLTADKGKKFGSGGIMKSCKEVAKKEVKGHEKRMHGMAKGGVAKTVTKEMEYDYKTGKKSFPGSTAKKDAHAEKEGKRVAKDLAYDKAKKFVRGGGIEIKGKTKGTMIKMCGGGMAAKKAK